MEVKLMVQSTPNPNALKFVVDRPLKTEGKVTYKNAGQCDKNPLAKALFTVANVTEVFFFDNYITITQDGNGDWDGIEEQARKIIMENVEQHDPNFETEEETEPLIQPQQSSPELERINTILDETVRPALQADGGDLHVLSLDGNVLKISYQGACGSCPSATMGTLHAIENLLKNEYNPDVVVELAQ